MNLRSSSLYNDYSLLKMGKSIEIRKFWSEQLVENFSQEQNNDNGIKF